MVECDRADLVGEFNHLSWAGEPALPLGLGGRVGTAEHLVVGLAGHIASLCHYTVYQYSAGRGFGFIEARFFSSDPFFCPEFRGNHAGLPADCDYSLGLECDKLAERANRSY